MPRSGVWIMLEGLAKGEPHPTPSQCERSTMSFLGPSFSLLSYPTCLSPTAFRIFLHHVLPPSSPPHPLSSFHALVGIYCLHLIPRIS
ncbi:hypothetical protein A0H81_06200 [Grifola frondosa]|uniref:Uncharacterized protein n=1 Tax=Grifola frondosa TaxID=5627 RepID=A0A1C7MBJ0_GRIFR|nr:hypothetical protein A0H81_06200 [Grifola frondosa]